MIELKPEELVILVRSISIFFPLILFALALLLYPLKEREGSALFLSFVWTFCSLSLLNPLAQHFGFWTFSAEGALLLGTPVDMLLGWALVWSVIPILFFRSFPTWGYFIALVIFDLVLMPFCEPVLSLHSGWVWFDLAMIFLIALPSRWLYEITYKREKRGVRNAFQAMIYTMVFVLILPLQILAESTLESWILDHLFLVAQLFFASLFLGLSALFELNRRGRGTPFPLDKTERLVTTGPYTFVRNPMQITTMLYFIVWFFLTLEIWFLGAAAMTFIYSAGYATWQEGADMEVRFGEDWRRYKSQVRSFFPRWKPFREEEAVVYLDLDECGLCADLGLWITRLDARKLVMKNAKYYPGEMRRMKYVDADGFEENGIRALCRVLEHTNFLLALFSFFVRLPIIGEFAQFFLDILAPPHLVCRVDEKPQREPE